MIPLRQIRRVMTINRVLAHHGLDDMVFNTPALRSVRPMMRLMQWRRPVPAEGPLGERIRRAIEELGPVFVKFGQIVSTRRDLLPDDIAIELARLQDNVPPFPGEQARAIVELAYRRPIVDVFDFFDETPLASASIAQVHAARLKDGREVIVKVVRPGIEAQIHRDIELMYSTAALAARYWPDSRRLRPIEVVADYERTIYNELDMMREAANAAQVKRNFADSSLLHVPEVHWDYARPNVLVMERISGIPISNVPALVAAGIDLKRLAENGVEIFFTQVFTHNFFHGDMHPGNIFVSKQGQYIAIDFGIMGSLTPEDKRYLAENFLAFFKRDYRRVAELHIESGWVPAGTRVDDFESAIRSVCDPIFNRPLKDISFGLLLLRLFQTARQFNMEVQPQLVLLQKTLLNIEGLGRQLYPELDLWKTAKPFMERWMDEQLGMRAVWRSWREHGPHAAQMLPYLPLLLHDVLTKAQQGKLEVQQRAPEMEHLRREIRRANHRTFVAIIGGACLIAAAIIKGLDGYSPAMVGNAPLLTWLLAGLGAWLLVSHWPGKDD